MGDLLVLIELVEQRNGIRLRRPDAGSQSRARRQRWKPAAGAQQPRVIPVYGAPTGEGGRSPRDADRLDLGRVGIPPDPARLCTPAAKEPRAFAWATRLFLLGEALVLARLTREEL